LRLIAIRPAEPLEEVQQLLNRILASREFDRFAAISRPALALSVADAGETIDVDEWRARGVASRVFDRKA
jgi:hypothetical protein